MERVYPTDLDDSQWQTIARLIPPAKPGGRHREVAMRAVVNGIFYILRSGCAWRMLPKEYPPWGTVYYYFARFKRDGTWQRMHDTLRTQVRVQSDRNRQPSAAILDSQSVKTTEKGGRVGMMRARR
jgi:putative transposase